MKRNTTTASVPGVAVNVQDANSPGDILILRPWFKFIRAARAQANAGTHTVLTFHIITDGRRRPVHYLCARSARVEPRAGSEALDALLEALGQ